MKSINGFEGKYAVTKEGMVWSYPNHIHKGRWLKQSSNKLGYKFVSLVDFKGKTITKSVHRLVACAYIKNKNNKPEINHKNLNPSDNRLCNLEWVTRSENAQHSWDNGAQVVTKKKRTASSNNMIKVNKNRRIFTMKQANKIRDMVGKNKRKVSFYCEKYNVSAATIYQIIDFKSYVY